MIDTLAAKYTAPKGCLIVLAEPREESQVLRTLHTIANDEIHSPRIKPRKATVVSVVSRDLCKGDLCWVKADPQMSRDHKADPLIPEGKELWFFGRNGENWQDSFIGLRDY